METRIEDQRITCHRRGSRTAGNYVLYWMQQAQRAEFNHALEYAAAAANDRNLPLLVVFCLTTHFPDANLRHYSFMLEGLCETQARLADRGIPLVVRCGDPEVEVADLAKDAAMLVMDSGYLRIQRQWRSNVADRVDCPVAEIESDVVVPVRIASDKQEIAARTLRPKLRRLWDTFLRPVEPLPVKHGGQPLEIAGRELPANLVDDLDIDRGVAASPLFRGGRRRAVRLMDDFIGGKLADYAVARNEPGLDGSSNLSPYLHFGQISPLEIALRVRAAEGVGEEAKDVFLEELLVRRELSMNFVAFNPQYDTYAGAVPEWARATLARHAGDARSAAYELEQLAAGGTDDPYWNAAQREMVLTGKMHGYMRMYWGKRLLEWHASAEQAYNTALMLNNNYELDGRDANGYTGVAWCFGLHDHPWPERELFGTVRCMKPSGLERKFDMAAYLRKIAAYEQTAAL
jgi:deoxyribodipyrimidine photo-lyase